MVFERTPCFKGLEFVAKAMRMRNQNMYVSDEAVERVPNRCLANIFNPGYAAAEQSRDFLQWKQRLVIVCHIAAVLTVTCDYIIRLDTQPVLNGYFTDILYD